MILKKLNQSDIIKYRHLMEKLFLHVLNFPILFNWMIEEISDIGVNMVFICGYCSEKKGKTESLVLLISRIQMILSGKNRS